MTWTSRVLLVALACAVVAAAPSGSTANPKKQLLEAINLLTEEIASIQRLQTPMPAAPDLASRITTAPPAEEIVKALLTPLAQDPFVDAYIRWQLTSFDPPLPEMTDQEFARFMDAAPPLESNPRAHESVINLMKTEETRTDRNERGMQFFRALVKEYERFSTATEQRNAAAIGFRDWVESKLPKEGPRREQWLLERCAATIQAGWPPREIKAQITKAFTAAATDPTLTPRHKQLLADQVSRLAGLKREYVRSVEFMADNSVNVAFSTAQVDNDDVADWIKRLQGKAVK